MVPLDLANDTLAKQQSQSRLCHEITEELEECIALCAKLKIDFYDCLAHARIDYEKHQRDGKN